MDIGEMKDKALAGLDKVVDSGKGLAGRAADRAKTVARAAKLRTEISTEKENLRKTYLEMGKLYYDVHKDDPEGFFIQLCDEVALSEKNIADKEAEIEALRSGCGASDAEIEVDFESVVAGEENAAQAAEEAAETVTDAADEAVEKFEDVLQDLDGADSDAAPSEDAKDADKGDE